MTPVIVPQGVFVLMGDLSITNGRGMLGGGVHNDGLLALDHTTVSDNHANDSGGGLYNRRPGNLWLLLDHEQHL